MAITGHFLKTQLPVRDNWFLKISLIFTWFLSYNFLTQQA